MADSQLQTGSSWWGGQVDSCNPELVKGKGTATMWVPQVAEMHSGCNPDQLCGRNQRAGRR